MKYRIMGIMTMTLMLFIIFLAGILDSENPDKRTHQHLTARQMDDGCDCDGIEFCTHLPLVVINTGGVKIPGELITDEKNKEIGFTKTDDGHAMLSGKISVMSSNEQNHHPSDQPDLKSDVLIRIRGNSSRFFEKKGYVLRLIKENSNYRDEKMIGMDPHYEWALHGPFLDKSLIRNYMWYNIAGEIMEYAPNVRFCEVILNGKYQGVYVMTETITNGEDCRLDISEPLDETNKTGYLLRLDRGSNTAVKNVKTFTNYAFRNLQKIDIKYPRSGELTGEMADAIAQEFSDFEKSLYSYDYDTDDYGYYHDIDVNSFVDYFIINEFTTNYDAGWLSTYLYRDIGGKYKPVIWDFNSSCDNYENTTMAPKRFQLQNAVWYYMLMKDEDFVEEIIERYGELRETFLSEKYLYQYIEETIAYLGPAVDRNFQVWGHTFQTFHPLQPAKRNPIDYESAIEQMKDFIHERGIWMDEHIEVLRQYCHKSKNKKFNH